MHSPATELTDVDVGLDKLLGIAWQLVDDDTLTASASLMSVVACPSRLRRCGRPFRGVGRA